MSKKVSGLFGGPLSTREYCEDRDARARLLAESERQREAAERKAMKRDRPLLNKVERVVAQPPNPKEEKKKRFRSDLDMFDDLDKEGPAGAAAKKSKRPDPPASSVPSRISAANGRPAPTRAPLAGKAPAHERRMSAPSGSGPGQLTKRPAPPPPDVRNGQCPSGASAGPASSRLPAGPPGGSGLSSRSPQGAGGRPGGPPGRPPPANGHQATRNGTGAPGPRLTGGAGPGQRTSTMAHGGPPAAQHRGLTAGPNGKSATQQRPGASAGRGAGGPRPQGPSPGGRGPGASSSYAGAPRAARPAPASRLGAVQRGSFYPKPAQQRPGAYRHPADDESEEDSDAGFIVEDEEEEAEEDWRREMRRLTGYDPRKFQGIDEGDDRSMVAGWREVEAEEKRSARMGRAEDEREEILERKRAEDKTKRKSTKKGGSDRFLDD